MKDVNSLLDNIRYTHEVLIPEIISQIRPGVECVVSIGKLSEATGVSRNEVKPTLKELAIAEVITFKTIPSRETKVTVIDEDAYIMLKKHFNML